MIYLQLYNEQYQCIGITMKIFILICALLLSVGYNAINALPPRSSQETPFETPNPYKSNFPDFNTPSHETSFEDVKLTEEDKELYKQFLPTKLFETIGQTKQTLTNEPKKTIKLTTRATKKTPLEDLHRLQTIDENNLHNTDFLIDRLHYTVEQAPTKTEFTDNDTRIEKTIIPLKNESAQPDGTQDGPTINIILRTEYALSSDKVKKIEYTTSKENPEEWLIGETVFVDDPNYAGFYTVQSMKYVDKGLEAFITYTLKPTNSTKPPISLILKQFVDDTGYVIGTDKNFSAKDIEDTLSSTWRKFFDYFTRTRTPGRQ